MDPSASYLPPDLFSGYSSLVDTVSNSLDEHTYTQTYGSNSHAAGSSTNDYTGMSGKLDASRRDTEQFNQHPRDYAGIDGLPPQNQQVPTPTPVVDLAEKVKGMYRLLDLIGESGSNGYVDKVIIAQDSLQRFINAISPGAYASITKVDFKTLDRLMMKPLGVYGSKDEIVRLLQSIDAVDENVARLLLSRANGSLSALSSGLYIVRASTAGPADERHYVIYWPEDSTWDDSAVSSVRRNRVTFMRYLTKICDQVVALLSPEHSSSIVWNDEDGDMESVDMDTGDSDRLFKFEVAKTNEQEEGAIARPGFQMHSRFISRYETPPDCPVDPAVLAPHLLPGETTQGFFTAAYLPHRIHSEPFERQSFSKMSLKQLLKDNNLVLSATLDENAVQTLVDVAISDLFPKPCKEWRAVKRDIRGISDRESTKRQGVVFQELANKEDALRRVLRGAIVEDVMGLFPSLERDRLSSRARGRDNRDNANASREVTSSMRFSDLEALYPDFPNLYQKHFRGARFDNALRRDSHFESRKLRLISVRHILDKHQDLRPETRAELTQTLLRGDFHGAQLMLPMTEDTRRLNNVITWAVGALFYPPSGAESLRGEMRILSSGVTDSQFLHDMKNVENEDLRPMIQEVEGLAQNQLASLIDATVKSMTRAVSAMQQEHCRRSIQHEVESEERKLLNNALMEFIQQINTQSAGQRDSVVYLDRITTTQSVGRRNLAAYSERINMQWGTHYSYRGAPSHSQDYWVTGRREVLQGPKLEFWVHLMNLTSDDRHNMQLDPKYIPKPTVNDRLSSAFHVPVGMDIAFYQLLEKERLLLILVDRDKVAIYLERLPVMSMAIQRDRPIKSLNREKLGQDVLFAFDETKRALAVCAPIKLQLHVFIFDETFKTLQGQGSAINLTPWYNQAGVSILQAAFVCGNEEVVLVDSGAQARIFSFITLQFRPASLQLPSLPSAIFSSPDGSCLIALHTQDSPPLLTAYHWETFGSTGGIPLDVPDFPLQNSVLTSIVSRGRIFLVGLDSDTGSAQSIAIDITKKVTEFMFKEKDSRNVSNKGDRHSLHNSLLDCHAEVWTRYPVVAAVRRRTVTSLSERQQKCLTFVSEDNTRPFDSYFSDLIQIFERETRKPGGDELRRINVSAAQFGPFRDGVVLQPDWNVSRYRVGEWLVDLLCLIPIHIAVCRENRFVPLANGVLSSDLERSLLGAEVNKIVDKLSFGWYESIFQSYLATKPVKVVSSMGQQSVGKSFSLNHLLDTSFAGSAMRTTEGVWMSVTPTDEALIVALDFEGVDSVERSIQEDTLLVLFNTAISNLVLFRNNFAFSRDISGLFQSFQSSASILNPAANPSLFQSTLDVVDTDKMEITREFSLKFQKIVQQEQRENFISRLHGGKLYIIPWPVIESKGFYKLFPTLKKQLDLQKISHRTAGEFLHTIKTLMAKLKARFHGSLSMANDWGALSQTMTEHRTKTLSMLLPIALSTGYSEVEPDLEPLKNFDTDLIVECDDSTARFAISEREQIPPAEIEVHITVLRESWSPNSVRQSIPDPDWMSNLVAYISGLIDLRVNHVRLWLYSNLERFQASHATIEDLRRRFDNMVIEMRTNVQLCSAQCALCHLLCVRSRLHEGDHSCQTTHKCVHQCGFCEDDPKACGTPAGHPGEHIEAHSCLALCSAPGICQIDTAPQSIEATFTGRHETFQYTKYTQVAKRLQCVKTIEAGQTSHTGAHIHSKEEQPFHFCETRYVRSRHFITRKRNKNVVDAITVATFALCPSEHETSHGSMTRTRWAVDDPDGTGVELGGRRFSSNDEGAPMMCNLVCSSMGRHIHFDYCRAEEDTPCEGAEVHHISTRMIPNPEKPKDAITHSLYWRRMGFKDPYTRDEQANFTKCDSMCSGPEHSATADIPGQPSYCTLPMFHPPKNINDPVTSPGYVSNDGHMFECRNPVALQQAFHVIFIIDRSGSMSSMDRRPLANTPAADRIRRFADNRLGAVYSALYGFWSSRHAAVTAGQQIAGARRDAYSVVLFEEDTENVLVNDFTSTPDQLLARTMLNARTPIRLPPPGFFLTVHAIRTPIMIFLSDGQCDVSDEAIQDVCRSAVQRGKPLSFHAVSFGPDASTATLRRMAQLALDIQNNAPRDPLLPETASVPSSFTTALDTELRSQ
ncbi:hypothetical protein BJV78DRAFT_1282923 [Lactifluus subvellereus]|nr:hypothetical protein BJV78DRAFT_1282923 [Lactifluus subvellereus]